MPTPECGRSGNPQERGDTESWIQIGTMTTTEVTGTLQFTASWGMSGTDNADFQMRPREAQRSEVTALRSLCCLVNLDWGLEAGCLCPTCQRPPGSRHQEAHRHWGWGTGNLKFEP